MTPRNSLAVIAALALALLSAGVACDKNSARSPQPSPNTMPENRQRERVGLQMVKPTWYFYRGEFGHEDWKLNASDKWLSKSIRRDSKGNPQSEEDYFYSGKTYKTTNGGQDWEVITVHYNYGSGALEVHYIGENSDIRATFEELKAKASTTADKLSVVDGTLKAWGLSRIQ